MKHINFLRGTALAVVAVFSIGAAQAATISGTLNFGGAAQADPGPGLGDATGLDFITGILVTTATGDFAASGIVVGDTGGINDFSFNPLSPSPVNSFLTIGIFSFSLESVQILDQQAGFLSLAGIGTLSGAGFDDTAYDFSMSVDGVTNTLAFSGTLAPIPVPGALLLFLSGLAALGVRRRN